MTGFSFRVRGKAGMAALLVWAAPAAVVPGDIFIKVGDLSGESMDIRHAGESDVISWSWGITSALIDAVAGGAAGAKASFAPLIFEKRVDTATPGLMDGCAKARRFDRAILTIRKGDRYGVEFFKIICEEVLVQSIATKFPDNFEEVRETIALGFARVGIEYLSITPAGLPGEPIRFAWNSAANSEGGIRFSDENPDDTDGDGLPNSWELEHGFNPELADGHMDADGDGASNYEEFVAGTDPRNKDHVFRAQLSGGPPGTTGKLTWSSVAGRQYRVLSADRVHSPFQLFGTQTAVGESSSIPVPIERTIRFFKVEVVPAD